MCSKCDALAADLTAEVMLAAAERELILTQADNGESVPHAIRPLSAAERKAKMRFGEIEALEQSATEKAAKLLAGNAQVYISAVISAIFGEEEAVQPSAVVDAVETLNRAQPDDVIAETAAAQKAMSAILRDVYAGSSKIVIGEAQRQGVQKTPKPLAAAPDRFDLLAKAVALHPWTRLTSKLQADMLEPRTLAQATVAKPDVLKSLEAIPLDGAVDLARQSIHSAHGAGRVDAAETMQPEEIYASELMDGATCDACARVDGKDYDSLAEAKTEYETGGYGACKGGGRCRGTLVFQYNADGTDAPGPVLPPEPVPVLQPVPAPDKKRGRRAATPPPDAKPATLPPIEPGKHQRYTELAQLPKPDVTPAAKSADSLGLTGAKRDEYVRKYATGSANPLWRSDRLYQVNCSSCVTTYELQRRGYDVTAAPMPEVRGRAVSVFVRDWWRKADGGIPDPSINARNVTGVRAIVKEWPDGGRGYVTVAWKGGGAHVFSVEKVDGKAVFSDPQSGEYDATSSFKRVKPGQVWLDRIDHLVPTDAVTEAVQTVIRKD